MGFKREHIEVFKEAQNLYGYHNDKRDQKAHVLIRRKNIGPSSNDLGFELVGGRYFARISQFDHGKYTQEWLGTIQQKYATRVALAEAKKKAKLWKQETTKQGVVRLVFRT